MRHQKWTDILIDSLVILLGTVIYSIGMYYFVTPSNIAPGGVSGIAILVNYVSGAPVGMVTMIINVPLLLIGWRFVGKEFLWKTILSIAAFPILYDYVLAKMHMPFYDGERIIACIFGGVLVGSGLGLVFSRSGSTGGTDIVSKLIHRKFPHIQLGRGMLMIDFVIITASIFVFKSIESALYAVIVIFTTSLLIDMVVYGGDKGKLVYIFSPKNSEISRQIHEVLGRGNTFLKAQGGYTGDERNILMCAVRTAEYSKLKRIVHGIDPDAFMIASDSSEVMGEGFKEMK